MKILFAGFECLPYIKVGGVSDVLGTLPQFIAKHKHDVRIILPLHKKIDRKAFKLKNLKNQFFIPIANEVEPAQLWESKIQEGVTAYFIESTRFFARDEVYGTADGDYSDNPLRYIFFSRAVLEVCKIVDFKPDVIHCNDMQTGLVSAYLRTVYKTDAYFCQEKVKTIFTIHNIAYQGIYPESIFYATGISRDNFCSEKLEFYGNINFMKAGIVYSDLITTVSPSYAREIQQQDQGKGLEGVLKSREKSLSGIINGIDVNSWNSQTDSTIKANYSSKAISNKQICKADLQKETSLPVNDNPVFGMVSRLDAQKGFDLILETIEKLENAQVIILGLGQRYFQDKLSELAAKYPLRIKLMLDFDNNMAHKIYAGSDFFLMPSHFEPCGLGQMIAMRYGTIPVARKVGGLFDTIKEFNSNKYSYLFDSSLSDLSFFDALPLISIFCTIES